MTVPTAVLGASGFLGGELLRLLDDHPDFDLVAVGARRAAGQKVTTIHPNLRSFSLCFEDLDPATVAGVARLVFLATPAEVSAPIVAKLRTHGVETVVDLSPAYRVRDRDEHRRWYPKVDRDSGLADEAVYGLPELSREVLPTATLIAAPGCFATASTLALMPLRHLPNIHGSSILIDAKSGSTGSGARPRVSGMHATRTHVIRPYAPTGHRHVPEIKQALRDSGAIPGTDLRLGMSVYAVDAVRGLLSSTYLFVDEDLSASEVRRAVHATFDNEHFVRGVAADGGMPLPDPRVVTGSNYCDVGGFYDPDNRRVVLVAALDNMIKGGAGQAVQAANVRYGLPETSGLTGTAVYP